MTGRRTLRSGVAVLALLLALPATASAQRFTTPTNSSPIAMSRDGRFVWVVNPTADSVSVIGTRSNRVLRRIRVGDEPQSVALDPAGRYAYVANAAGSGVTVIRITSANPRRFRAGIDRRAGRRGTITTGSEPWNIVSSPDGRRVFVANSGQDTITVIDATRRRVIGSVDLQRGVCNRPNSGRHFQPRGLAVTQNNRRLYVTSLLAFARPGGRQASDTGKQGVVCRLDINTRATRIRSYRARARIVLAPQVTGFTIDSSGDGQPDATSAFPNQLQSIVIRGGSAYLPNIAASPDGPLRFNVDTQAFVSVIDGVRGRRQRDAGPAKFLNLHLGAREPETGKRRLFFSNPWAIAFTSQRGSGEAYVVSAGSDLLVKVRVSRGGKLSFTGDENTTRYIDLNDPDNAETSGANAGKNPQGIVINRAGTRAYVANMVSRNVSVVDLSSDEVDRVIRSVPLPEAGSREEVLTVGAEVFFGSRGNFDRPEGATISTRDRLSSEGWQSCASCHFEGLTDGVVWEFGSGPRKSVPLNASFNPDNPDDQRLLNYSAIFDEIEDFEGNIRNTSGPGPIAAAAPCSAPPPATSTLDPNHGLLVGDADFNLAPCVLNAFPKPNADRNQVTVTLPGSSVAVPALTAMREWSRFAVRTPTGDLPRERAAGGDSRRQVREGRGLFARAGCTDCHVGGKFTISAKGAATPPPATDVATETTPPPTSGNPVPVPFIAAALRDIGSFNRGVPGGGNELGNNVGGDEKAPPNVVAGVSQPPQDALGRDYNGDGKGNGFNVPSLLGIDEVPPYYHNGACETLACVVSDEKHRTANGTIEDRLEAGRQQAAVVAYLRSIDARTPALSR